MSKSKIIILLGFGSILLLGTLLITIGVSHLNKSKSSLDHIVNSNNLKIQLINKMYQSARERTVSLFRMIILDDPDEFEKSLEKMHLNGGKFMLAWEKFIALDLSQVEKKMFAEQAAISAIVGPLHNKIADLVNFGDLEQAQQILVEQAEPLQDKVLEILIQLQKYQRTETQQAIEDNSNNYKEIVTIMWVVSSIVILICFGIIFFTLRLISKNEAKQERYQEDIERQAFYDHLTGLPNRRLLNGQIKKAINMSKQNELLMAVLFIDCDRFKPINDSLGHVIGDNLLVSIANRLKENVRSSDTVCRVSGDEFAIVLENIKHITVIDKIAQGILNSIAAPHILEGHKVFTTVSIGVTVYPLNDKNINGLLTSADIAMYHAKQNGGNQYEYFNSEMNKHTKQKLTLEQDLHEALTNNELQLYYQPQNQIDTKRTITGAEVLLRWNHPKKGMIPPHDFIGIAEESGLIVSIGEWVLISACKQIQQWQRQGLSKISISVNLSPKQFAHSNLLTAVKNALDESGIEASQLVLEITESTAMGSIENSIETLHQLKSLGVNISIDDFGTGYSSLSYLQTMPIDNLKIDRSFIKKLHRSEKDKAFVQAIVTMAHTLGMKVIAEGVEVEEQFLFLQDISCEIAQGFLFSKPVPAEELEKMLW